MKQLQNHASITLGYAPPGCPVCRSTPTTTQERMARAYAALIRRLHPEPENGYVTPQGNGYFWAVMLHYDPFDEVAAGCARRIGSHAPVCWDYIAEIDLGAELELDLGVQP